MLDTAPVRAFLDDKHVTLAERVSDFATRLLAPRAEPTDDASARQQARELLGTLGAAGWFQPIRDQDWRACCIVREVLAAASPLADAVFALQALGVVPMLLSTNDAMRKRWLDAAIQGRAMASFAMTEP
ncbi:MAG TPA: acyl-CoA dehydrogenase family protein, partial [Gemmatimonadales bacterium]